MRETFIILGLVLFVSDTDAAWHCRDSAGNPAVLISAKNKLSLRFPNGRHPSLSNLNRRGQEGSRISFGSSRIRVDVPPLVLVGHSGNIQYRYTGEARQPAAVGDSQVRVNLHCN